MTCLVILYNKLIGVFTEVRSRISSIKIHFNIDDYHTSLKTNLFKKLSICILNADRKFFTFASEVF